MLKATSPIPGLDAYFFPKEHIKNIRWAMKIDQIMFFLVNGYKEVFKSVIIIIIY